MFHRYFSQRRIKKGIELEDSVMAAVGERDAVIETPLKRGNLDFLWYVIVATIAIVCGRVFFLDSISGQHYSEVSRENRIRSMIIKAPRGMIVDKYGKVLAGNIPSIDVIAVPHDLPADPSERKRIAREIAETLNMDKGNVETILESQNKKSFDPVLIAENITREQSLVMAEKGREFPGIMMDRTAIRNYENSAIFAPVIGYDGKITREEMEKNEGYLMTDYIGKTGIEKSYEEMLRGVYGKHQVEIDSLGNVKKNLGIISPKAGNDLVLNVDEELQKKLYDSLSEVLEKSETKTAAAVAIDPRNGGVLAMISLPSFDNNMFARGITNDEYKNIMGDKNLPLFNRVTDGEYPPGSTLKPAVAAAAMEEGTITPETVVNDGSGAINVGAWRFGDWKTHGVTDVRKAIAESCDVFFYAVGGGWGNISGLGMSRMKKYENMFGFGSATGIDFPNESEGFLPDEEWKLKKIGEKWYIGDSYHAAIGQGFVTATPLQLANYTAALANGGTLYSPRIVNRVKKNGQEEEFVGTKVLNKDFISEDTLKIVREGMRQTVTSGTAQTLNDLPVPAAGKTGTAQFGTEDKTHAWFVSFAPYDSPTIAMAVLVEGGGEGHSSAVPVTRDVYEWYFSKARTDAD